MQRISLRATALFLLTIWTSAIHSQESSLESISSESVNELIQLEKQYELGVREENHQKIFDASIQIYRHKSTTSPRDSTDLFDWGFKAIYAGSTYKIMNSERAATYRELYQILVKASKFYSQSPETLIEPNIAYAKLSLQSRDIVSNSLAIIALEDAKTYVDKAFDQSSIDHIRYRIQLAHLFEDSLNFDEADKLMRNALRDIETSHKRNLIFLAATKYDYAVMLHRFNNKLKLAKKLFKETVALYSQINSQDIRIAKSLVYLMAIKKKKKSSEYQNYAQQLANWKPIDPNQKYERVVNGTIEYPPRLLHKKVEGFVEVKFTIDSDGSVINPQVMNSEPGTDFVRTALKTINKSRFTPQYQDGRAIQITITKKLTYRMNIIS